MKSAKTFAQKLKQNEMARQTEPMEPEQFAHSMTQLHIMPEDQLNRAFGRISQTPMHPDQKKQMMRIMKLRAPHLFPPPGHNIGNL